MNLPAKINFVAKHYFLGFGLLLCLVPGILAVLSTPPTIMGGDGPGYHQIAINLLQRHVYSAAQNPPFEPTIFRTPGYPFFLASVYTIFGQSVWAVRIAQLVLSWLSAAGAALIARRLFSPPVAFICCCLVLLYLPFVSFVRFHLTETLTTFLLIWSLWLFLRINKPRLAYPILCGATLALLILVRPSYLPLAFLLLLTLPWKRNKIIFRNVANLLLVFSLPIALWIARNSFLAKQPVGLSSEAGLVLYESALQYSRSSYALPLPEYRKLQLEIYSREPEVYAATEKTGDMQVPHNVRFELAMAREYRQDAARIFHRDGISDPLTHLPRRVAYLWSTGDLYGGWVHTISRIEHYIFVPLVAFGCGLLRKQKRVLLLLITAALYVTALHLVFQVEARYSVPARLPLMVVAAYAVSRLGGSATAQLESSQPK